MSEGYLDDKVFCSIKEFDEFGDVVAEFCGQGEDVDNVMEPRVFSAGDFCPKFKIPVKDKSVYFFATPYPKMMAQEMTARIGLVADAAKEDGAKEIFLIAPDLLYARQDKSPHHNKKLKGTPYSSKWLAKNFRLWGIDKILTFHLHSKDIYNIYGEVYGEEEIKECRERMSDFELEEKKEEIGRTVLYNINPNPVVAHYLRFNSSLARYDLLQDSGSRIVFISPDAGAKFHISNLQGFCFLPESSYCNCRKLRSSPNNPEDVKIELDTFSPNFDSLDGKIVIIADDMVDTGGTIIKTCKALMNTPEYGTPKDIILNFTHSVLKGSDYRYVQRGITSARPKEIITTNTHPYIEDRRNSAWKKNSSVLRLAYHIVDALRNCVEPGVSPKEFYQYASLEELKAVERLYDIKRDTKRHFLERR
jgi:ribose-phosphate pyrophosphokinase